MKDTSAQNISAQKKELRHTMTVIRSHVSADSRREQSITASLLAENEVLSPLRKKRGGRLNVFCYVSFRDEPETIHLIQTCLGQGDRVLVPKVMSEERKLALYEMNDVNDLIPGVWGIPEPGDPIPQWPTARYAEIDIIIVPGLAYDRHGGRIGFGGGYYDRFMEQILADKNRGHVPIRASLALEEQIVQKRIPMEEHDFRLDMLFTASGMIYI
ncbi:5-formyltetrahydrofolate cyclo-ligase [Paenibacillus sp. D2_2]|uniref:5-formyltetrahydrofolate cyclo-ligase n=1 Tax=Paenibacillus sp. D2_2 TaxID=3073092 RepID=UPI002815087E|nr:5-formyltetrahydrofolate cyclo-ligase [Paenibacillus sp. D2_2]WMT42113.1 5-formyltetrahydrofolate cyclo-ligase [Paenibacillus sp. D2_2]